MMPRLFLTLILLFPLFFSANDIPEGMNSVVMANAPIVQVRNSTELQNAINSIADGGIIEMMAGTYYSPNSPSYGGFQIGDMRKGFVIRAAPGATVYIDGQGSRALFRFINTSLSAQKPVTFTGINFRNGYSNTAGLAAGVTLQNAEATFINCGFTNNRGTINAAGGATQVSNNSIALFVNSSWSDNTTPVSGAAIEIQEHAKVYIHASQFFNNRTNIANHVTYSAGGAIHIGNSTVRISNSRFDNNQAGYVGGAVYAIGDYSNSLTTNVIIANSTFINNKAMNDPGVPLLYPTEGGAVHFESNAIGKIYNSRFFTNQAISGGAINTYRSGVTVEGSVFLGNQATGIGTTGGLGGAIAIISNDTPVDGNNNYPSASLSISDSYIQGRYGSVTNVAQVGGGIYAGGDVARVYGLNVTKMGTVASNRATVTVDRVTFVDSDTLGQSGKTGGGGAIYGDLAAVTVRDSVILSSDASGGGGYGGALAAIDQSDMSVISTLIGKNSATMYGGAVFGQGSNINLSNTSMLLNTVGSSYGSAVFAAVEGNLNLNMTGNVQTSRFVNNSPSPDIFDDDRNSGPINTITYNQNNFYGNNYVYKNSLTQNQTVSGLNSLVVTRSNGTSTDKATIANSAYGSLPKIGLILAAPSKVLSGGAVGDLGAQPAYLAYGWVGGNATVDGSTVSGNAGWSTTTTTGNHTLDVAGTSFTTSISQAPTPAATLTQSSNTLTWSLNAGTFIEAMIDNQANIPPLASSGSVQVSPQYDDTPYWLYMLTKEGGVVVGVSREPQLSVPADVYALAGRNFGVNMGSIPVQNVGGGILSWTATNNSTDRITLQKTSGEIQKYEAIPFTVNPSLGVGLYTAQVVVVGGAAGTQTVTIHITVYDTLWKFFLPRVSR